jgi:hypothetical protein
MVPVPTKQSLLLVTHANQEASFEYGDYWEGPHLIYTGRGQDGDQVFGGPNRDVAENRRTLWLFEHREKYQRRFLGRARCTSYWWAIAPDKNSIDRRILKFRLELSDGAQIPSSSTTSARDLARRSRLRLSPNRAPRPFDATKPPTAPSPGTSSVTPEEIAQLTEKANAAHHRLLVELKRRLEADGWSDIEEIPGAVDLWARRGNMRVLFEAKTIAVGAELTQTRAALSQLLEYRFFYGAQNDSLCLVTNVPLSDRRLRFLNGIGVDVLWYDGDKFVACGSRSERLLSCLGDGDDA